MFIGHFVVAEAIHAAAPSVPLLPMLIAVGYADILRPFLVWAKKEKVGIDPNSPLQKTIKFISYPHSHSLVRSAALTLVPALAVGLIYQRPLVGLLFYLAAMSHWPLDVLMHVGDMPILGFGKDKKIGFGLWRFPAAALIFEYIFFAAGTLLFIENVHWWPMLIAGLALHFMNANSFFAFTKTNPTKTPNQYAALALFGFGLATVVFNLILT